jgi:hypothetical protein
MKLLTGGQSGVDRAVLDIAIERGIDYGGWCPKGGWAEDMTEPPGLLAKYPNLRATPKADPAQRTDWNVRDADACMIVVEDGGLDASKGTALAQELAHRYRKPLMIVRLGEEEAVRDAGLWLRFQQRRVGPNLALAIGGPRESEAPGIYASTMSFLAALIDGTQ